MFVVYTEIHQNGTFERWYYGMYKDSNRANEVALDLGHDYSTGTFHCVCDAVDAKSFGILNLPAELM